jgi:ABC-type sulfate transport system permease component
MGRRENSRAASLAVLYPEVLLGLAVAHVLHCLLWRRAVVRTLVLTPLGIPTIVVGVMFAYLPGVLPSKAAGGENRSAARRRYKTGGD